MSPVVQSSPLAAYWRTTIQRPVYPDASVPVILNLCQEVVSVIWPGPGEVGRIGAAKEGVIAFREEDQNAQWPRWARDGAG